jgi:N-acetylglucosaminyl-diphospho-decaprenol L-rhamnosyltransferase
LESVRTVDVVVVSYNSRATLRRCVMPLAGVEGVNVTVVDNASPDKSLEVIADLPVHAVQSGRNGGFAFGCNIGWRFGDAPQVLFLNPDATVDLGSVNALCRVLDRFAAVAAVGPRIIDESGELDHSQRRFPRLRSTYAQALFLHRVFRGAQWTDEVMRDPVAYETSGLPDWISGACVLVRRHWLYILDGLDEQFFMYCEDIDLARRLRDQGMRVAYEPAATVVHQGGGSSSGGELRPALTTSRIRYASKHRGGVSASVERLGVALGELTHAVAHARDERRRAYGAGLAAAVGRAPDQATLAATPDP